MKETVALRKNKDVVTRVIDDETILLPIYKTSNDINCIYTLNKVASRVWELIDGKRAPLEIKNKVLKEFDTTPQEVDKEMQKLLKDLQRYKGNRLDSFNSYSVSGKLNDMCDEIGKMLYGFYKKLTTYDLLTI